MSKQPIPSAPTLESYSNAEPESAPLYPVVPQNVAPPSYTQNQVAIPQNSNIVQVPQGQSIVITLG